MTEEKMSGLDRLREKYKTAGSAEKEQTTQQQVQKTFNEKREHKREHNDRRQLERLSKEPAAANEKEGTIGELHREMAAIQLDLYELNEQYGRLNTGFRTLVGKDKIYTLGEAAKLWLYKLANKKEAAKDLTLGAIERRGNSLEVLVNNIAEVIEEQHQKSIEGKEQAKQLQVENISHMRYLDEKLIDNLKGGNYTSADLAEAESEITKLEQELEEIGSVLMDYETKIKEAKAADNMELVNSLTEEVSGVLDIKYQILNGKLSADGVVSDIRRTMLDHAEGTRSAKEAAAAAKVNYLAINALIDSMAELEIKYRHAKDTMVPVFITQAKIAGMAHAALDMKELLTKTGEASQKLMDYNAKLVMHLARETLDLLKTPLLDEEQAYQRAQEIQEYMTTLNQEKKEWAETMQTFETISTGHYTKHQ